MTINLELISVRDLTEPDIPYILKYWFHSPKGFIESMGVDHNKLPKESKMQEDLKNKILENQQLPTSKLNSLVITHGQLPIGFHTIYPLVEGDYGIFHAHIWNPAYRRKGIGLQSYPRACRVFLERFSLNRILFKTPIQNVGAVRVKEKLGIRYIGEEAIGFGIIKDGTLAKVFELTRAEANLGWPKAPTSNAKK